MPSTDVGTLAESPVRMARKIVNLEQRNTEMTWALVGLAFVVWILLMSRR